MIISRARQHAHTHDDGGGGSNRGYSDISDRVVVEVVVVVVVVMMYSFVGIWYSNSSSVTSSQVQGYTAAALHARQPDCATSLLFCNAIF